MSLMLTRKEKLPKLEIPIISAGIKRTLPLLSLVDVTKLDLQQ